MKIGQFAVVDERDPSQLKNGRHEIVVVYDDFGKAVETTERYVQQHPHRKYVVLKAIALVEIDPSRTKVTVLNEQVSENKQIQQTHEVQVNADLNEREILDRFFGRL